MFVIITRVCFNLLNFSRKWSFGAFVPNTQEFSLNKLAIWQVYCNYMDTCIQICLQKIINFRYIKLLQDTAKEWEKSFTKFFNSCNQSCFPYKNVNYDNTCLDWLNSIIQGLTLNFVQSLFPFGKFAKKSTFPEARNETKHHLYHVYWLLMLVWCWLWLLVRCE